MAKATNGGRRESRMREQRPQKRRTIGGGEREREEASGGTREMTVAEWWGSRRGTRCPFQSLGAHWSKSYPGGRGRSQVVVLVLWST